MAHSPADVSPVEPGFGTPIPDSVYTDRLGFFSMDANVPGLSRVILNKLNMRGFEDYRAALEGKPLGASFGFRSHREMFQRMEDTFKFCAACRKLPAHLTAAQALRRCKSAILACRHMGLLWDNAGKPRPGDAELRESVKRVASEFLSRPLALGLGLRLFGLDPGSGALTVHLVGASHSETLGARTTDLDELSRMFPGHQGLEVVMVGPEVVDGPVLRPPLQALGPRGKVYISAYKGLYHQFWEELVEQKEAAKPDLVVGFHPGFHATQGLTEGWLPTLLLLRDYKIPSLFTMYNEQELKYSLQILTELEVQIVKCGVNPFASLKPEQVQSSPNKPPVYCNSHYISFHGPLEGFEIQQEEEG
nr:PREDICTED: putative protein MSS51 homolog, mitochondrial [Lepisosteus oculatus]